MVLCDVVSDFAVDIEDIAVVHIAGRLDKRLNIRLQFQ